MFRIQDAEVQQRGRGRAGPARSQCWGGTFGGSSRHPFPWGRGPPLGAWSPVLGLIPAFFSAQLNSAEKGLISSHFNLKKAARGLACSEPGDSGPE